MSNRWVRRVFLGLIFVFPLLLTAVASNSMSRPVRTGQSSSPLLMVEVLLVGGVVFAGRERRRLLSDLEVARTRADQAEARPSAALAGPKIAVKAPSYSMIKR